MAGLKDEEASDRRRGRTAGEVPAVAVLENTGEFIEVHTKMMALACDDLTAAALQSRDNPPGG